MATADMLIGSELASNQNVDPPTLQEMAAEGSIDGTAVQSSLEAQSVGDRNISPSGHQRGNRLDAGEPFESSLGNQPPPDGQN